MELEEMKAAWQALSEKVEKQEKPTHKMIEKMTEQKFRSGTNSIFYSEILGSIICFAAALFLIVNFHSIDQQVMQVFGAVCIGLLIALPVISLITLRQLRKVNVSLLSYAEAIQTFTLKKIRFQNFQKLNIALALFLMVLFLPVLMDILGKDISQTPYFWSMVFPLGVGFFIGFAIWVMKHYNNALRRAEEVLSELDK